MKRLGMMKMVVQMSDVILEDIDYSNQCPCGNCRRIHRECIVSFCEDWGMTVKQVQAYFKKLDEAPHFNLTIEEYKKGME